MQAEESVWIVAKGHGNAKLLSLNLFGCSAMKLD
jgi:hypothetical protein